MSDFQSLREDLLTLKGATVPKPSGTLAGHAAGLPFERLVHERLTDRFGTRALRHFEFLNRVLEETSSSSLVDRLNAFGPASLQGLLCRGKEQMKNWSPNNPFEEKQNDTAESIISDTIVYDSKSSNLLLLDVKTFNSQRQGQPPNIISAGKLSEALARALEEGVVRFDFVYVGMSWEVVENTLTCNDVSLVSLFKMEPQVYINWAAAEQIQFHPHQAAQSFGGTREEWARDFLTHFVNSLKRRIDKQHARLARFENIVSGN